MKKILSAVLSLLLVFESAALPFLAYPKPAQAQSCSAWEVTCPDGAKFSESNCSTQDLFNKTWGDGSGRWKQEACASHQGQAAPSENIPGQAGDQAWGECKVGGGSDNDCTKKAQDAYVAAEHQEIVKYIEEGKTPEKYYEDNQARKTVDAINSQIAQKVIEQLEEQDLSTSDLSQEEYDRIQKVIRLDLPQAQALTKALEEKPVEARAEITQMVQAAIGGTSVSDVLEEKEIITAPASTALPVKPVEEAPAVQPAAQVCNAFRIKDCREECEGGGKLLDRCQETGGKTECICKDRQPVAQTVKPPAEAPPPAKAVCPEGYKSGYSLDSCPGGPSNFRNPNCCLLPEPPKPECTSGTRCEGTNLQICSNNRWVTREQNSSQCGGRVVPPAGPPAPPSTGGLPLGVPAGSIVCKSYEEILGFTNPDDCRRVCAGRSVVKASDGTYYCPPPTEAPPTTTPGITSTPVPPTPTTPVPPLTAVASQTLAAVTEITGGGYAGFDCKTRSLNREFSGPAGCKFVCDSKDSSPRTVSCPAIPPSPPLTMCGSFERGLDCRPTSYSGEIPGSFGCLDDINRVDVRCCPPGETVTFDETLKGPRCSGWQAPAASQVSPITPAAVVTHTPTVTAVPPTQVKVTATPTVTKTPTFTPTQTQTLEATQPPPPSGFPQAPIGVCGVFLNSTGGQDYYYDETIFFSSTGLIYRSCQGKDNTPDGEVTGTRSILETPDLRDYLEKVKEKHEYCETTPDGENIEVSRLGVLQGSRLSLDGRCFQTCLGNNQWQKDESTCAGSFRLVPSAFAQESVSPPASLVSFEAASLLRYESEFLQMLGEKSWSELSPAEKQNITQTLADKSRQNPISQLAQRLDERTVRLTTDQNGQVAVPLLKGQHQVLAVPIAGVDIIVTPQLDLGPKAESVINVGIRSGEGKVITIVEVAPSLWRQPWWWVRYVYQKFMSGVGNLISEARAEGDNVSFVLYFDKNSNGKRDADETDVPWAGVTLELAEKTDRLSLELLSGWNLVHLPFVPTDIKKASDLLLDIARSGGYATTVATWQDGAWKEYTQRGAVTFGQDFAIGPGRAYFVLSHQAITWVVAGKSVAAEAKPLSYDLGEGWNAVGVVKDNLSAAAVLAGINADGENATEIVRWESGLWDPFVKRIYSPDNIQEYGNNFAIEVTRGYLLRLKKEATWQP